MKNLIAITFLTLSFQAFAQSISSEAMIVKDRFYKKNFKLGLEIQNWDYQETANGQKFMSDSGMLYGLSGALDHVTDNNFLLQLKGSFVTGTTKYNGQLIDYVTQEKTPYKSDSKNNILTMQASMGRSFLISESAITPTVGIAYRSLFNKEMEKNPYDYDRKIDYIYAPIALSWKTAYGVGNIFEMGAAYNYFIGGTVQSGNTSSIIKNKQKNGSGQEAWLAHTWAKLDLGVKLNYKAWKIGDSEKVQRDLEVNGTINTYNFYEPANKTQTLGASIFMQF